jgi:uncharacterized membrane protein
VARPGSGSTALQRYFITCSSTGALMTTASGCFYGGATEARTTRRILALDYPRSAMTTIAPDRTSVTLRAAALGLACGGRSVIGLAAVATRTPSSSAAGWPLRALASSRGRRASQLSLLGELVADKLPATPSRLKLPALLVRIGTGAMSSYLLASRFRTPPAVPVLVGAVTAALGSALGARWRAMAAARGWPDLPAALLEDMVIMGLAAGATGSITNSARP